MTLIVFFYLLSLVCWLGAIIFFSFFTAPVVFGRLPVHDAGKVISAIFPRYYLLGYVAGTVALVLAFYLMAARGPRAWWSATIAALVFALGCTLYAGMVVRPRIDAIRTVVEQPNPDPVQKADFDRMHQLSVTLNGLVLLLDLFALFTTAGAFTHHG